MKGDSVTMVCEGGGGAFFFPWGGVGPEVFPGGVFFFLATPPKGTNN